VALCTHHQEKRTALRNAVLNIALGRCPEEDEAEMFLRYIEELQPWHIRVLTCLSDTEAMNEYYRTHGLTSLPPGLGRDEGRLLEVFPELKGRNVFYDKLVLDLYTLGLYSYPALRGTKMVPSHGGIQERALAFLNFISSPI
jgi:hypothetical protein